VRKGIEEKTKKNQSGHDTQQKQREKNWEETRFPSFRLSNQKQTERTELRREKNTKFSFDGRHAEV
jgi:hypothetical protein